MTFKDIHQFIIALKQDLILEELLIEEYSAVLSGLLAKKEFLDFLTPKELREIGQISQTLKNDSLRHKEAIKQLIDEATTEGIKQYMYQK